MATAVPFELGRVYNRRQEIHRLYRGQQQGGISTPSSYPFVFIFSGDEGAAYGPRRRHFEPLAVPPPVVI